MTASVKVLQNEKIKLTCLETTYVDGYLQYFLITSALVLEVIVIVQVCINIIYTVFALLDTNTNKQNTMNMNKNQLKLKRKRKETKGIKNQKKNLVLNCRTRRPYVAGHLVPDAI